MWWYNFLAVNELNHWEHQMISPCSMVCKISVYNTRIHKIIFNPLQRSFKHLANETFYTLNVVYNRRFCVWRFYFVCAGHPNDIRCRTCSLPYSVVYLLRETCCSQTERDKRRNRRMKTRRAARLDNADHNRLHPEKVEILAGLINRKTFYVIYYNCEFLLLKIIRRLTYINRIRLRRFHLLKI